MPMPPAILEDLRTSLGLPFVLNDEGRAIVSPQTTEQVALVTRYANDRKLNLEIRGAGTQSTWGNPVHTHLILDTTSLTGVQSHSWQDLTATVSAGTPWSTMQQALAQHHQQVALDPLWPTRATVGGIIATNDSGALRLKYGSLRDLIIGMTIVLADGTIAKSGGKVVKNVAGYDLHKLMTGAFGTLGIIADVTFRLHPLPSYTLALTITAPTAENLGKLLLSILNSQLSTQSLQLRATRETFALDIQLATLPEALTLQSATLEALAKQSGLTAPWQPAPDTIFATRQHLLDQPAGAVFKVTMLPSAIAQASAEIVNSGGSAVTQATGIMFARFNNPSQTPSPALTALVKAAGNGSITVLRQPSHTPASILAQTIKSKFDPHHILNPGHFPGGL